MYENVWKMGEMIDGDPETFVALNKQQGKQVIGHGDEVSYFAFMNNPQGRKSWASAAIEKSDGTAYVITYWGTDSQSYFTHSTKKSFSDITLAKKEVVKKITAKSTTSHGYVMTKGSMSAEKHANMSPNTISKRNTSWRNETNLDKGIFVFRSPERPEKKYCPLDYNKL